MQSLNQKLVDQARIFAQKYVTHGKVAQYIPALANVDATKFGISVATVEGALFASGDCEETFSIQSISKVLSLSLGLETIGDSIWQHVGRHPSSNAFNSLIELELQHGKPRNPFINAGALRVADLLTSRFVQMEMAVVNLARILCENDAITYDLDVADSEIKSASRNRAAAYLMQSFGLLNNPVEQVIAAYCKQCAIKMTCTDLAKTALCFADRGCHLRKRHAMLDTMHTRQVNTLMLTCGNYESSGEIAYRLGVPSKSGVGGGIMAVIPGQAGVCVWSPGLDSSGVSVAGFKALEFIVQQIL